MPKTPERKTPLRTRVLVIGGVCLVAFASTALAARTVRGFLENDPRLALRAPVPGFKNRGVVVTGANYTSIASVQQAFAQDYGHSIFRIDLKERRLHLLAINWVRNATVSRVWPDRVYVHIEERKPVAYVNVPHQGVLLVDGEGVLLSPPRRSTFGFPILNGVLIDQTEPERKARVQTALRLLEDLGPAAKDVSEVNVTSPDDPRITTEVQGKTVELWLGDDNFGQRYRNFTDHFADIRAGSPRSTVFDLRIDDRITAK